jgi:hypothetical protein
MAEARRGLLCQGRHRVPEKFHDTRTSGRLALPICRFVILTCLHTIRCHANSDRLSGHHLHPDVFVCVGFGKGLIITLLMAITVSFLTR